MGLYLGRRHLQWPKATHTVLRQNHADFAGGQFHETANRIDAYALDELLYQPSLKFFILARIQLSEGFM